MKVLTIAILFFLNLTFMYAVETSGEKFQAKAKRANRGVKKVIHKSREMFCVPDDIGYDECLLQEKENRLKEAEDKYVDRTQELKNKID